MTFSSVLLPEPLAPITQTSSPRVMPKEIPSACFTVAEAVRHLGLFEVAR